LCSELVTNESGLYCGASVPGVHAGTGTGSGTETLARTRDPTFYGYYGCLMPTPRIHRTAPAGPSTGAGVDGAGAGVDGACL
jgi:hypothetical protein